jgi:hypothetical protein
MTKLFLLSKKSIVERFLKKTDYALSAFSFVNIFTWKDFFDFRFQIIGGTFCIFAKNVLGSFLYLPPLGKEMTKETIDLCFEMMFKENKGRGVSRIENVEEKDLSFFPKEQYQLYKKSEEFVYRREDIACLRGNKYKSKRALYNQFVRQQKSTFVAYTPKMRKACLQLYLQWAKERKKDHSDDIYQQMIDESYQVHDLCLRYHQRLGLVGRVVFVQGVLSAYSFGFVLKDDTFCVLLEVADLKIKGLPTYIFKEFCSDLQVQNFPFVNVMDDFGLDRIRKTKLLFRPCQVHACYVVSRKDK